MYHQRELTAEEQAELDRLNESVTEAIRARRAWLDAKMHEISKLKPGDGLWDVTNGRRIGRVRRLYRYWADHDDGVRDTEPYCDYEYDTPDGFIDNTSRQLALHFGTKEEAAEYAESRARALRSRLEVKP